jgi:hypothetical protein
VSVTWEQAIEECEARLDAASAALEHRAPAEIAPFSTPAVDGPIPAALVERARACSARSDDLSARLTDELERVRLELRRLPRMPRAQGEARFEAQA